MPKISVYLPDDLAEAVREAQLPVSSICQAALSNALSHNAARVEAAVARRAQLPDPVEFELPVGRHLASALHLAYAAAGARGSGAVESEDLLMGILDERESLTLRMIETLGIHPADVRTELDSVVERGAGPVAGGEPSLSASARHLLGRAEAEARQAGGPLVNCSHLLLALVQDVEGVAGGVLRRLGLDPAVTRRAADTVRVSVSYGRFTTAAGLDDAPLRDIRERLERIEAALGQLTAPRRAPPASG